MPDLQRTNEKVSLDGAVQKFLVAARSFAAELEREKTSQRTHEHLLTKARRGLNVGGRVYGYENVEIRQGEVRVRVEYRIHTEQAAIVKEIFERYAAGEGLRAIVKDLNDRRIPSPRAGKRGTGSWSTSAIWTMLRRDRYRGFLIWNKLEKTYRKGTKVSVPRPRCDWIEVKAPHLRIVSDELWLAAHAQMRPTSPSKQKGPGRPTRYLDQLVVALASTDQKPEPLVHAVAERQTRLGTIDARLRAARAAPEAIQLELRRMDTEVKGRLAELDKCLDRNPEEAQRVIEAIFDGPLTFKPIDSPDGARLLVEGKAAVGRMLAFETGSHGNAKSDVRVRVSDSCDPNGI